MTIFLLFFATMVSNGQTGIINGKVTDAISGEILVGVNIITDSLTGVTTDVNGFYNLKLSPGKYNIFFRYVGYLTEERRVTVESGQTIHLDIPLKLTQISLETAVITAGRFKQRLSDVTVSMEIIQPEYIENTNTVNLETVIEQIPGVEVLDGQASIRGGGGYSFGAGSRVQLLVDELPMLTADVNEVKWNFLPVENIEHVEILKGASSALYGSSALNGVINIITAWPDEKPQTTVNLYGGLYTQPKNKNMSWWWDDLPLFGGGSFTTSHKLGNFDLVAGANGYTNEGYRKDNYEKRIRASAKFRHRPDKIKGFTYGLSTNIQWQNNSDFFIWQDADSGAFLQREDAVTPTQGFRFNADPWVSYFDKYNNRHSLKTRYYSVYNRFQTDPEKDNGSDLFYGEYQYHRNFKNKLFLTAGFTALYGITNAKLYGDHNNSSLALYTQLDYAFNKRLKASLGLRWERYTLDNTDKESSPVIRAGLNYKAAEHTFLRASFGQGYRFPSIAEKYTATTVGSLNIFPNPDIISETGWSTEIGIKQGFKLSNWKGYIDVAGYWTEYQDMIEFTFGVWLPDSSQVPTLDDLGFKSLNVGQARINGIDINLSSSGLLGNVPLTFLAGYTYMNPIDLTNDTLENNILKYRYKHSFKGDIGLNINKFSTGISFRYNSFMERIDEAFEETILGQEIFPGLKDYREQNNSGSIVLDLRLAYQFSRVIKVSLLSKNLLNEEYMGRPGDIREPRSVVVQVLVKL